MLTSNWLGLYKNRFKKNHPNLRSINKFKKILDNGFLRFSLMGSYWQTSSQKSGTIQWERKCIRVSVIDMNSYRNKNSSPENAVKIPILWVSWKLNFLFSMFIQSGNLAEMLTRVCRPSPPYRHGSMRKENGQKPSVIRLVVHGIRREPQASRSWDQLWGERLVLCVHQKSSISTWNLSTRTIFCQ